MRDLGKQIAIITAVLATLLQCSVLRAQATDETLSIAAPKALSRQQGDNRPEGQLELRFLDQPLTIGGEYEFNPEQRRNLNLGDDTDAEEKLTRIEHKFELEAFYDAGHNVYVFAETKLKRRDDSRNDGVDETVTALERGESWVYVHVPEYNVGVQVGRQSFKDKREWWWDADLDAARLRIERGAWSGELAIAQELAGVSSKDPLNPEQEDVTRWIGNMQWRWADRQTLDFFWLNQRDRSSTPEEFDLFEQSEEDSVDADLNWVGIRSRGTVKLDAIGRLYYWMDFGTVSGNKRVIDFDDAGNGLRVVDSIDEFTVRGSAFDVGVTWRWRNEALGEINLTAGLAQGSGDNNLTDDRDDSFHQTGLQDNNGKYRGVSRFRYYGELFRPELSNIQIVTASIGRRFLSGSSIELIFHNYRQLNASTTLRDSRLRINPGGLDRQLGLEFDVVVSLEEWVHWEIELVGAAFQAGKAFADAENNRSYLAVMKVNYNF